MKNGESDGESGILPEMTKAAGCKEEFLSNLLELVQDIWESGCAPCARHNPGAYPKER